MVLVEWRGEYDQCFVGLGVWPVSCRRHAPHGVQSLAVGTGQVVAKDLLRLERGWHGEWQFQMLRRVHYDL